MTHWRTFRVKTRPNPMNLVPIGSERIKPLDASDLPLIFLTRNSFRFIPSFLAHYRALGITRFLCVDDQSTDGTRERLSQEGDVDLFGSDVRFRQARGGKLWREALVRIYGRNRWYMNVDCDEYFIYDKCETKHLSEFIARLEALGVRHCPAPMIDCYPEDSIQSAVFDGSDDVMPWTIASMLDGKGYRLSRTSSGMEMTGGPRDRIAKRPGVHEELMKYPLVFVEHETTFSSSIHKPWPFTRNFSPILGSLLHFKFFNDTEALVKQAIDDGQYFKGSRSYKNMLKAIEEGRLDNLRTDVSVKFKDSKQMSELGFFKSPFA